MGNLCFAICRRSATPLGESLPSEGAEAAGSGSNEGNVPAFTPVWQVQALEEIGSMHTRTYTHRHTHTHARAHTRTHSHTHTHIHAHAHTYTQVAGSG